MLKNSMSVHLYKTILLGSCFFLLGCQTCTFSRSSEENISLQVPYVKGDERGDITNDIILALGTKANVKISNDSRYKLSIELLDSTKEPLTYRFNNPKEKNNLVSCEDRLCLLAKVTIIDTYTDKILRGPGFIQGFAEYDHQHRAKSNKVNQESLGQLEDTSADRDMRPIALNRDMATKIALWTQQQLDLMPIESEQVTE